VFATATTRQVPEISELGASGSPTVHKQCELTCEKTHYFYSRDEPTLAQQIHLWVAQADKACTAEDCGLKQGLHKMRHVHGGTRVDVEVQDNPVGKNNDDDIYVWESCICCNASGKRKKMSDASW
jgi:hypothetical protein